MSNSYKKLIVLPGNDKRNREWIDEVAKNFGSIFEETRSHYYKHWENDELSIDFDHEVNEVTKKVVEWEEFTVFAKSAGTLITLMSLKAGKLKPKMAVFVGFPLDFARQKGIDVHTLIRDIEIPLIVIQKKNDPQATAEELENFLKDKDLNYTFVGIEGDDHHYEDIELLKDIFLDKQKELLK